MNESWAQMLDRMYGDSEAVNDSRKLGAMQGWGDKTWAELQRLRLELADVKADALRMADVLNVGCLTCKRCDAPVDATNSLVYCGAVVCDDCQDAINEEAEAEIAAEQRATAFSGSAA